MIVRAQIVKWGNSQAVRIPKALLEQAKMREGEQVELRAEHGRISVEPAKPKLSLSALVELITPKNKHGEQAWGKHVGNEPW